MNSGYVEKNTNGNFVMEFVIDTEFRETTITSVMIQSFKKYIKEFQIKPTHSFDYVVTKNIVGIDNSMGGFLLHFIKADFTSVKGFSNFINNWGISGLIDINPEFNFPSLFTGQLMSANELKQFNKLCFEATHNYLVEAQQDFLKVMDYCTDISDQPLSEPLKPHLRYYIGSLVNDIPSLNKYCGNPKVIYQLNSSLYPSLTDPTISKEQLCKEALDKDAKLTQTYYVQDFRALVYHEFFALINELLLKKCSNCGSYFIAKSKINEVYCENCRNVSYSEKVKKDPLQKAYHTAYKTRHREKQKKLLLSPDNQEWINKWDNLMKIWIKQAKEQLELAKNGKITSEQFIRKLNITLSDLGGI